MAYFDIKRVLKSKKSYILKYEEPAEMQAPSIFTDAIILFAISHLLIIIGKTAIETPFR